MIVEEQENTAGEAPVVATGDAPRVLVVEDDPVLLTILTRYLGQRGCCVLRASSL